MTRTAHLASYDTLADWETGYLLVELRTGRFTGEPWQVVTVAATPEPVTTMGGVRIQPDLPLDRLSPDESDLLILPGFGSDPGDQWAAAARDFLDAGTPVAAICGATELLARAGLLDDRDHTSGAADYLAATGYAGTDHYVEARAAVGGQLITAGPDSPAHFAAATLRHLGLMSEEVAADYLAVLHDGDARAYPGLMRAAG